MSWLFKLILKPAFWIVLVILVLITIPYYAEALEHPAILINFFTMLGLTRHSFERVLYLAPIIWGAFLFGRKGAVIISFITITLMLPRALLLSSTYLDDIFEISAIFIMGNILAITIGAVRGERERRIQLEIAQKDLKISEERYRSIFENALDAIWLHDLDGNVLTCNESAGKLTGFNLNRLVKMNVKDFLSDDSLKLSREIRRKLLTGQHVEQPYEQCLIKNDKSEAFIQIVTSLIYLKGEPVAFQHIARDITEQKRFQENLRFYSQKLTRMFEDEKERLSRKVYDELIQLLTVHSRQLDEITSNIRGLSKRSRTYLENVIQQTNNMIEELHNLGSNLRPPTLDHLGLLPALKSLSYDVAEQSGIAIKVESIGTERRLPKEIELVLFRITEEALRNTWRHSGAPEVDIAVEFGDNRVKLIVSDNGKGSNLPKMMSDLVRDGKLGLAGMQERALLVGGTLIVKSEPGKGTSIAMEVPA